MSLNVFLASANVRHQNSLTIGGRCCFLWAMKSKFFLVTLALLGLSSTSWSLVFDAAPFALPLREGNGLQWEDPREIHQVTVHFTGAVPAEGVRLEYWGSRWPQQHLPKDREPGGGDVGWM